MTRNDVDRKTTTQLVQHLFSKHIRGKGGILETMNQIFDCAETSLG